MRTLNLIEKMLLSHNAAMKSTMKSTGSKKKTSKNDDDDDLTPPPFSTTTRNIRFLRIDGSTPFQLRTGKKFFKPTLPDSIFSF